MCIGKSRIYVNNIITAYENYSCFKRMVGDITTSDPSGPTGNYSQGHPEISFQVNLKFEL